MKSVRAVIYGDVHYPWQDDRVLELVKAVGRDFDPHVLINMGDTIDANAISKHPKKLDRISTLQDEVDLARTHLDDFSRAFPKARRIALEGNHEERLTRSIDASQGELRELFMLDKSRKTLTWPVLLDTEEKGWEWVGYREQEGKQFLPKFMTIHGSLGGSASKAGYSAHREMAATSKSGASGHTHRLAQVLRRDVKGANVWVETGCCCGLNPPYGRQFPDWQQGFVLADFLTGTGAFDINLVYVFEGVAYVNGYEYNTR